MADLEQSEVSEPGFFGSVRSLLNLFVRTIHTRIELFSVELKEESQRVVKGMVLISAFIFLAAIAVLLVSFTIIFSVWDDPAMRVQALWILSGLYILGAALAGSFAWRMFKTDRLPFADSLHEFKKDREWIQTPPEN